VTATQPIVGAAAPVVLRPIDVARAYPDLGKFQTPGIWVYRYTEPTTGWRLSIATCAEPGSHKLSLGGFRIAPDERTSSPDFDSDREAVSLAVGMEEKVYWSRLVKVGGPLALRDASRIVGGKCVLHPTADARMGQPRDRELLDFAIACFHDIEARAGFYLTTGQDLGHGTMSDGTTTSLQYLNARFKGSVVADTSKPTGEGNYHVLAGMLRGTGIAVERATVGLIGCGNIGMHIIGRLRKEGTAMLALESNSERREQLALLGIPTFAPEEKNDFLRRPMDAVVVNASGDSLDAETIARIGENDRQRVVCGSENLVMRDHDAGSEALRRAKKAFAPTELGGMMGYLTAVEEYLARVEEVPFDVRVLYEAAKRLESITYEAARRQRELSYSITFESAVRQICES
jgi:predicted dinucleotide-utilizing enzyme